jgi:hypothetical protein
MTTILDPTDERKPVARQITARSGTLSGTIGLLDIRKPRGNVLLDELERQIRAAAPDVTVKRFTKPTITWSKRWLTEVPVRRAVCTTQSGLKSRESHRSR